MSGLKFLLPAMLLLIGACEKPSGTTQPAPQSATQPRLKALEMRHRVYLFRHDVHTTITPDGLLRSVQIHNKTYGPGDADPKSERVEVREGHLTPQQMDELAAMFEGWESLATTRYGGVPDGGEIEVSRKVVAQCRCGRSATRPFCDGTHKAIGFRAESGVAERESRTSP